MIGVLKALCLNPYLQFNPHPVQMKYHGLGLGEGGGWALPSAGAEPFVEAPFLFAGFCGFVFKGFLTGFYSGLWFRDYRDLLADVL